MKFFKTIVAVAFFVPIILSAGENQKLSEDCQELTSEIKKFQHEGVEIYSSTILNRVLKSCQELPNLSSVELAKANLKHNAASTNWELLSGLAARTILFIEIKRHGNFPEQSNSPAFVTTNNLVGGQIAFDKVASINGTPLPKYQDFQSEIFTREGQSNISKAPYSVQQAYLALTRIMFDDIH